MKYKKLIYCLFGLIILAFGFTQLKAQSIPNNLSLRIRNIIYYAPGHELFSSKNNENKAFTFGMAISINEFGKVDTVIFTNTTKSLDSIVSFKYMTKQLKKEKTIFNPYKNTILVTVVLVRRGWDKHISNFYDYFYKNKYPELSDFDENFFSVLPNIDAISRSKKVKLFPSINFVQPKAGY